MAETAGTAGTAFFVPGPEPADEDGAPTPGPAASGMALLTPRPEPGRMRGQRPRSHSGSHARTALLTPSRGRVACANGASRPQSGAYEGMVSLVPRAGPRAGTASLAPSPGHGRGRRPPLRDPAVDGDGVPHSQPGSCAGTAPFVPSQGPPAGMRERSDDQVVELAVFGAEDERGDLGRRVDKRGTVGKA